MNARPILSRKQIQRTYQIALVLIAIVLAILWHNWVDAPVEQRFAQSGSPLAAERLSDAIQPIPMEIAVSPDRFALGRTLFEDKRLSADGTLSCASCHKLNWGGADGRQYSKGLDGKPTAVNTPTIFNLAYNFRYNWNGQHETLRIHTEKLMNNPSVMAGDWDKVVATVRSIPKYQQSFQSTYNRRATKEDVIDAIVAYESVLTTPNAPFDQFLRGEKSAISEPAKQGYTLFKDYGCISCHQGVNIGGNMFQKFGVVGNYFTDKGLVEKADLGRFNVTNDIGDRHVFRVPSLRNVAETAPYLHDGTAQTLEDAIRVMAKYQLGRSIPEADIKMIAQFLNSLTGEYDGVSLSQLAAASE